MVMSIISLKYLLMPFSYCFLIYMVKFTYGIHWFLKIIIAVVLFSVLE